MDDPLGVRVELAMGSPGDLTPPMPEATLRECWAALREELLAEESPGSRPWAWFAFDHPEIELGEWEPEPPERVFYHQRAMTDLEDLEVVDVVEEAELRAVLASGEVGADELADIVAAPAREDESDVHRYVGRVQLARRARIATEFMDNYMWGSER